MAGVRPGRRGDRQGHGSGIVSSKATPKADALRALRESDTRPMTRAGERMPINDDATAKAEALLIRARYRLNTMPDPSNPSPDEVLIHDLARMLVAAFSEGEGDDALPLFGVLKGEVLAP